MIRPEHVALLLGLPLLFPLVDRIDAHPGEEATVLITLPPDSILPALACGHAESAADLLEIRATNYVFEHLEPGRLLDPLAVTRTWGALAALDPRDPDLIQRGAVMLGALSDSPDDAIQLLERGIRNVPPEHGRRWRLYFELAAIHLVSLGHGDPAARLEHVRTAGELLQTMAGCEGIPEEARDAWRGQGERLRRRGLDRLDVLKREVELWEARSHEGEPALRERARERKLEAEALLGREQLQRRLDAYRAQVGRSPTEVAELATPGTTLPEDPLGIGFYVVGERIVAPAAEARALQRTLQQRLELRRRASPGALPPTLEELLPPGTVVPPWLHVDLRSDPVSVQVDLGMLRR